MFERHSAAAKPNPTGTVALALLIVYVVWGTTYLAIRLTVQTLPPLFAAGIRFLVAGGVLYLVLRAKRVSAPSRKEWAAATLTGSLMWVLGNGGLTFAEQWVPSGLAAVVVASVPLWAALFAGLWAAEWPRSTEWVGLVLGASGVASLCFGANLSANPLATAVLLFAAASFALGSVLTHHLPMPGGLMGSAAAMLTAGPLLLVASAARGEHIDRMPSASSLGALAYLIVFGAMVGASAYVYLLRSARPALATSYAFVNPVVAVIVGSVVAGERLSAADGVPILLILVAVGLVVAARARGEQPARQRHGTRRTPLLRRAVAIWSQPAGGHE